MVPAQRQLSPFINSRRRKPAKLPASSARACCVTRAIPTSVCLHLSLHLTTGRASADTATSTESLSVPPVSLGESVFILFSLEKSRYVSSQTLWANGLSVSKFSSLASPKVSFGVFGACTICCPFYQRMSSFQNNFNDTQRWPLKQRGL